MSKDSWREIDVAIGQRKDIQKCFLPVLYGPLPELWFLVQKTPALTGPRSYGSCVLSVPQDTRWAETRQQDSVPLQFCII